MGGTTSLKEADAFQRLVCVRRRGGAFATAAPQRSRRLSASGIRQLASRPYSRPMPSKKQTPFSVWYGFIQTPLNLRRILPQRSRRLSASGMRTGSRSCPRSRSLKEADAFQRLVSARISASSTSAIAPQRSRRLSASGIWLCSHSAIASQWSPQRSRRLSASGMTAPPVKLEEFDFPQRSRRLSASGMGLVRPPLSGGGRPSKKQTPFSVWYNHFSLLYIGIWGVPQRSRRLSASGMLS